MVPEQVDGHIFAGCFSLPSLPVNKYMSQFFVYCRICIKSFFNDHISGICKSTHFHLRGIGRIRNLLTFDATAQLIHALITSRLDFCNSILYNLPNKQIERLQRIQNQAARMLKRIPWRNHITPVLRELHWLRIHDRIIF